MFLLVTVIYLASSSLDTLTPYPTGAVVDVSACMGAGMGVILAVAVALFSVRLNYESVFKWMVPLVILQAAVFPYDAEWARVAGRAFSWGIDSCVQAVSLLYVLALVHRGSCTAALGIGLLKGFMHLGICSGKIMGHVLEPLAMASAANRTAVALVLICAFACVATALQGTSLEELRAQTQKAFTLEPAPTGLVRLATAASLTPRETQVLSYLVKGRSVPFIQDELVLSKSTVNTHVRHIYQKMGVRTRQELLDKVEQAETTCD